MPKDEPYDLIIERNIVDKLGLKLYDKISAVVAELVANSYDADSEEVVVEVPLGKYLATKVDNVITDAGYTINIVDKGHGMTPKEANELFLKVGKEKWVKKGEGVSREKGRNVMGRKGIGKLSPFGVCKTIEVWSAGGEKTSKGYEVTHFKMNYEEIIKDTSQNTNSKEKVPIYHPEPFEDDHSWSKSRGTIITLKDFLIRKVPDEIVFHKELSYRFGLNQPDFEIKVKDNKSENPVPIFTLGEYPVELMDNTKTNVDDRPVPVNGEDLPVKGWVGFSKHHYKNDDIAGVRIYVRGKIAAVTRDFGLPSGFSGEFAVRSYLIGEIHVDWLDNDEDLIQTSRQDILWSSELGEALAKWGQELVKEVARAGRQPQRDKTSKKFMEISKLAERAKNQYAGKPKIIETAIEFGKKIGSFASEDQLNNDDGNDYVEGLTQIILTLAPHKLLIDAFKQIEETAVDGKVDMQKLKEIFETTKIAQLASYGQLVAEKLSTIDLLETTIRDRSALERDLQEIIEDAPWLIDASFITVTTNQALRTFKSAFEEWYFQTYQEPLITSTEDLPDEETPGIPNENKRPDFILLNIGHYLLVLEIKGPNHTFNNDDWKRFEKYHEAIEKFSQQNSGCLRDFPGGVKYVIIAKDVSLTHFHKKLFDTLIREKELEQHSWETFLANTKRSHRAYLEVRDIT